MQQITAPISARFVELVHVSVSIGQVFIPKMEKKETILLDAHLISVIDKHAFDAELSNGHRITAFVGRGEFGKPLPQVGAQVIVEMSPYDMSKGRLVLDQEQ